MEKKHIIAGIAIFLAVLASFSLLFFSKEKISEEDLMKIQEAQISLEEGRIVTIAGIHPKYGNIQLEYYYRDDYCADVMGRVAKLFDSIEIIQTKKNKRIEGYILEKLNLDSEENISLPIAVLKGDADIYDFKNNYLNSENFKTIINGFSACSEKILIYNLCKYSKEQTDLCSDFSFEYKRKDLDKSKPSDFVCYESCNVEYISDGNLITQYWRGPPCSRGKGDI